MHEQHSYMCDHIWDNQPVRENEKFFLLLRYLLRRVKLPPSKYEANPTLHLRERYASFF